MIPDAERPVSRETSAELARAVIPEIADRSVEQLLAFEQLLVEDAVPRSAVAASDIPRMFERHVADSLRGALALRPDDATAIDAGSGAGLPGIPVSIAAPDLRVVLVEPRQARAAFLEMAVERLGLENVSIVDDRVEAVADGADVVFSRAFVPLAEAWPRLRHLVTERGRLVFFAGVSTAADEATVPEGASSVETLVTPVLATSGPLIIIAR